MAMAGRGKEGEGEEDSHIISEWVRYCDSGEPL